MSEEIKRDSVEWEPIVAGACFAVAVLSLVFGFMFTTEWLLRAQLHPLLHAVGLLLLIVGIPMIILGGHFMDLREKKAVFGTEQTKRRARQ